jgi:hypothetical protein
MDYRAIISRAHKCILLPYEGKVPTLWPKAELIEYKGRTLAKIPHGPKEQMQLEKMGIAIVPAPILEYYDWEKSTPFEVQKKTAALITSKQRDYVLNDMGCVDRDTEYLSETGWKKIGDYTGGRVAQYWPQNGTIDFVEPTQFVKLPCEEMIRFKTSRGIDQLLSPEHRVLLVDGSVFAATEIEAMYYSLQGRGRLRFPSTFRVSGTNGLSLSDAEIRLQVAVNADGTQPDSWRDTTVIELRKLRKIDRLRGLLAAAKCIYREKVYANRHIFSFKTIRPKGFNHDWWWQATQAQLEIIAEELHHWDGTLRPDGSECFSSSQRADADFAQYAYSAMGRSASLYRRNQPGTHWRVYASRRKSVGLFGGYNELSNISRELSPDGYKYCFVVPSTFLLLRRNGCVFCTGNTGKTRAALFAWRFLNRQKIAGKLLVVAPLSTLKFTWAAECRAILPDCKVAVLHGTAKKRLELLKNGADIFIINHDGLKTIVSELWNRTDINFLILDELAVYRNESVRSKQMRDFAQRFTWVVGMTGRPMPQAPTDVWGQCKIVTPGACPKFFRHARTELMVKLDLYKWAPKPDAIEKALSWMQPSVRYSLDDVVELPEAIYRTIDVELTKQQLEIYVALAKQYIAMVERKQITAANAAVALGKLLQVGGGYVYTSTSSNPEQNKKDYVKLDSAPRQQALLDIIESAEHKIIVAMPWTHQIEEMSAFLTNRKEPIDHAVVYGKTTHREKIFDAFQNSEQYRVLLTHPRTTHHGITLTAADTAVWYSPHPSLEVYEQFNARIRRVGQKHKQQFIHLLATSAERRVYNLLHAKQRLQDAFLQMLKEQQEELQR